MTYNQKTLKNRIALVTGASRGIGAAVSVRLAELGAHVILVARTEGGLEEVDDAIRTIGGTATLTPLDLTEFDKIAEGKKAWNQMIASFYGKFHEKVENVIGSVGKASGERELGIDPTSGNKVFARIGPFGPMVQLGEKQEDEDALKPKFASLIQGQTIQNITLKDAIELFKLPRKVGEWGGKEIVASVGRFGPYLRYDGKFTSIKKTDEEDPLTISLDRSIELIKIKIQADNDRLIANFEGDPLIQVLNGRYGPFIQVSPAKGKKINVKIPKGTVPKDLTREECVALWKKQPEKKI